MTPAYVRRQSAVNRRRAQKLREEAAELLRLAGVLDRQADELDIEAGLIESLNNTPVTFKVKTQMHSQHKLAISEGRATRDKKFKKTIREAEPRYTQAALATAVEMQPSLLSMCRSGERAIYLSRAKRIEQLTGWPADKAHWPGGIIEDA